MSTSVIMMQDEVVVNLFWMDSNASCTSVIVAIFRFSLELSSKRKPLCWNLSESVVEVNHKKHRFAVFSYGHDVLHLKPYT